MAAPGRVELEEDVLFVVDDEVLVALRDYDGDGALLLFGDGLALDAGLDGAGDDVVDEFANLLLGEIGGRTLGGERELLVLRRVLDGEGGPCADLEVQVAGVLAESLGVDGGEVELSLMLLGDRLQGLGERFALCG